MNHRNPYILFGLMVILSFGSMYVLMYAMVDVLQNVYPNYNQLYMAGLMTSPMIVIEMLLMGRMYPSKVLNMGIIIAGIAAMIVFFFLIRAQVLVNDVQFLRSMIPHHAGAILMCQNAELTDPQILELCSNILSGQQQEIDWMKAKLDSLGE